MASRLPSNPSIEHLRDEARTLQRANRIPLHQAQLTVARAYGFSSWPRLVHYLRDAAELSIDPGALDENNLDTADRFCSWASLRYNETDAPPRWQAAWSGDLELIRRLLDAGADATITDRRFGSTPLDWAEHAYQTEAANLLRGVVTAPSDPAG